MLSQFALIVVDWPIAGEDGLALGAQVGVEPPLPPPPPPPEVTQVSVWFGAEPDRVKLLQLEPV